MTFLYLIVVLTALFITVFNSHTSNHLSTLDQDITKLTKKPTTTDSAANEVVNSVLSPSSEASVPNPQPSSQILPTFS